LKSTSDGSGGKNSGNTAARSSSQGGASARVARASSLGITLRQGTHLSGGTSIYQNNIGVDGTGGLDVRHGWTLLTQAIEKYEKGLPTCMPCAFLVVGSPGSGKTCLLCRLVMDCLETQHALVPLLFTVADLVRRSTGQELNPETMNNDQVHAWFDRYLRITYGEDSQRYHAICQAIRAHRVLFLFEGLEEGGHLTPVIERLIANIVLNRHLCVVTTRPLVGTSSRLQDMGVYVSTLKLQAVTDEQKRAIASSRLGVDGLAMFDRFFARLRERQGAEGADGGQEDVFGNPMMLSMLLCYLQLRQNKAQKSGEHKKDEETEEVTLTSVYRVAVDVMLLRVQSKSQAERHNKDEKVEQSKCIMEMMAAHMQEQQALAIDVNQIPDLLEPELLQTYEPLKEAVMAGHAILLRMSNENSKTEFRFLVKGFQDFFAACDIVRRENQQGRQLPVGVLNLLEDPWWIQMLDMLAENWPTKYVDLIEKRLPKFHADHGDTFLHIAARVGHRPVFQLLKHFKEEYQTCLIQRNKKLETPLHLAAEKGHTNICIIMLQHKAEIQAEDSQDKLPIHSAMTSGNFQTAKVLLEYWNEWSRSSGKTYAQKPQAEKLASKIFGSTFGAEQEFLDTCTESFVELKYFTQGELVDKKRSLGALLSVYCIISNKYQDFSRAQPKEERLTEKSWEKLQKWTTDFVGLTKDNCGVVGAMLVFVSIMSLGKIVSLREAFAPEFDDPGEALGHILTKYPILIPSFWKLDENLREMIKTAVKADFNFGQFLQTENLAANLFTVKEILGSGDNSESILGFILFRIFAAMCGILGAISLDGSLFMKEGMYTNFKTGLDELQRLVDLSAVEVYNNFLRQRAKAQVLTFNDDDNVSRAVCRLACLCRVFDQANAKDCLDCFQQLEEQDRNQLTHFLNADGVTERPGYLLFGSPQLMENSHKNKAIGRYRAMQMLLSVYQLCAKELGTSKKRVVTIMLDEIAAFAKKCDDPEIFDFTKFYIARKAGPKADSLGTLHLYPWQLVTDLSILEGYNEKSDNLIREFTGGNMREPAFVKRLSQVYPELSYFMNNPEDQVLLEQTKGAFLMVYWTVSNQREAIIRAQEKENQLTDKSWYNIYGWAESFIEVDILNCVMVVIVLHNLGKVKRLADSLAPGVAGGDKHVLAHVIQNCPKVLPSYYRLNQADKWLVRQVVTSNFSFEQFLHAENLPSALSSVKAMLSPKDDGASLRMSQIMEFYLFSLFVTLGGCMGNQSLEGSLFMTEGNYKLFNAGKDALMKLTNSQETVAYNAYLEYRAKDLGISFDQGMQRAVIRVALMCQATDTMTGLRVSEQFKNLDKREQELLAKYLNADGLREQAFMLAEAPTFLKNAWNNKEVGLPTALRILLRVYQSSEKEFARGSKDMSAVINLQRLHKVAKEFFGSVEFQDLPFELIRENESTAMVNPKVWIPVTNTAVLDHLQEEAKKLAQELLDHTINEEQFKTRISRVYPELSYFAQNTAVQRDQTHCALLSVFWLVSGQREAFTKCQDEELQLSRQSWAWIQEWMAKTVKLSSEEVVDAVLAYMAIHALGKIPEFREDLTQGYGQHEHDLALAKVLEEKSQVVPSFLRLDPRYKRLMIDCLSTPFQFGQFLQGEDIPASLVVLKEKLQAHGDFGFGFFTFGIFARNCGKHGPKTLQGSAFMNEPQFERFKPGIDAIQQLRQFDPQEAYNRFLLVRGSKALSRFASPEHQAITRLLCLCGAYDIAAGVPPCEAFDDLTAQERAELSNWLTMDGIKEKPGYVLADAPQFLRFAQANEAVGLVPALKKLVEALKLAKLQEAQVLWTPSQVILELHELASWAQDAGDLVEFQRADLQVVPEQIGDTSILIVKVNRSQNNIGRVASGGSSTRRVFSMMAMLLLLIGLGALAAAASVLMVPKVDTTILQTTHVHPSKAIAGLCLVSAVALSLSACVWIQTRLCGGGPAEANGVQRRSGSGYGYERLRQSDDDLV